MTSAFVINPYSYSILGLYLNKKFAYRDKLDTDEPTNKEYQRMHLLQYYSLYPYFPTFKEKSILHFVKLYKNSLSRELLWQYHIKKSPIIRFHKIWFSRLQSYQNSSYINLYIDICLNLRTKNITAWNIFLTLQGISTYLIFTKNYFSFSEL